MLPVQVHCRRAVDSETYGKLLIAEASSCYGFDPRQHLANFHASTVPGGQQSVQSEDQQPGLKAAHSHKPVPRGSLTTLKIPQIPPSDFGRSLSSAPVAFPGIEPAKPKPEPPEGAPKGEKLWPCPSCKVPFKAASELQQHLGQHARSERAAGAVPCEVCGKLFASAERVRAHVRASHGEKACACDICGSGFSYRCKLLDHMRTHTGDKPYRCEVCGKSFSQKNHLTRHAMIHTGERPFPCDFCGRGFYRKDKLSRHRRVHTGERPHVCLACGKSYGRREKLARHLRAHAGERPFACAQCGRRFLEPRDLHRHKCPSRSSGQQPQADGLLLLAGGSPPQLAGLYQRLQQAAPAAGQPEFRPRLQA
ncbi:zinc finger protein 239 isoform X2 [Ixodes scapularis]|uniref:zinc finger protein 239 isoform X2 n=1 Tax=Ixodes scapularis TaxID=6945 RepID=UPI0011617C0D|nr:zinc finger protein 239 isoform X2 [Ixodes scapularis]